MIHYFMFRLYLSCFLINSILEAIFYYNLEAILMLSETISTGYDDSLAELKDLQNLVKNLSGHETAISKDSWSRELSSLSSVVSGCEVYGIYRMERQEFVETYKSDPIFRCKVGIMFKEEKEMLERHPEYRAIKRTL